MNARKERLESLLLREIATCVQQELRDPRLGFITVVRVEMTADLQTVRAYWTVLGGEKERRLAAKALDAARGFVQTHYAPVLRTRLVPKLEFRFDEVQRRRQDIDDLIRRARASDPDGGSIATPPAPDPAGGPEESRSPPPAQP